MMSKIEEVARAIAKAHHSDDGDWIAWTGEARAAIEAMKGPTGNMVERSKRYMDSYSSNLAWWDAMIDAALAEGPK